MNVVLRSDEEVSAALAELQRLWLPMHPDRPKNWDATATLDLILREVPVDGRVLDAGAGVDSNLLPCLFLYGYQDLHARNLAFDGSLSLGPIRYSPGDITRTGLEEGSFDAIACLSVIEHGVDTDAFLEEAARLLRPGGLLVVSCDFWDVGVDTSGKSAYGVPVKVFDRAEIEAFFEAAGHRRLRPLAPPSLECTNHVVHWSRVDLAFTFVVVALRKEP